MLRKLVIENFQVHRRLEIDLSRITVFAGESDAGKSSVLRALGWLFFNVPSGMEFLTHGESEVSALLEVDDHAITRLRSKERNEYILDGKTYKAIGVGVPDEIARIFGVGPDQYQGQHEAPFWFSLSPGEVSKKLDNIIDLGAIDHVLSFLGKEVRDAQATLRVSEGRLHEIREQEAALAWVPEAMKRFDTIQKKQEEIALEKARLAQARLWIEEATYLALERERFSAWLTECLERMQDIATRMETIQREKKRLSTARALLRELQKAREERCRLEKDYARLQEELRETVGDKCPFCHRALT